MAFIDVPIVTDPVQLAVNASNLLQAEFVANGNTDWTPNPANLEIILLMVIAQMATTTTQTAAQVTTAIFRKFGTLLFNVPYQNSVAATALTTWTLTDANGHRIPASTFVDIGGEGFSVVSDVIVAPGQSTAVITVVAADNGEAYNGLGDPTTLIDGLAWGLSDRKGTRQNCTS